VSGSAVASIVPIAEEHIEGFRAAVDSVARERRYLARFEAPAEADVRIYVRENIARVDNERAKRLYERCGFLVEGLCRRHMLVDGEFRDSWLMALTNG
jgi:ribosomal protein S18 acetylase RimI-like enzyme